MSEAQKAMSDIDHYRNSHPEWIKEFKSVCSICGERFRTQQLFAAHEGHKHPKVRTAGFVKTDFRCHFCEGTFTRLDGLNKHKRICKNDSQTERRERKKSVRRGTRQYASSIEAQPKGSDNGLKGCLKLTELDTHLLGIFCRYPECRVATRYHQHGVLRHHYRAIHNHVYLISKPVSGKRDGCNMKLAQRGLPVMLNSEHAEPPCVQLIRATR